MKYLNNCSAQGRHSYLLRHCQKKKGEMKRNKERNQEINN